MNKLKYLMSCVMLALLLTTATPAAADEVKSILQFLSDAKIVDQKIVDASDLIRCFVDHSPEECIDLQPYGDQLKSEAVSAAEKKAAEFVPDDPMVATAIDIVRAALKKDWLRVLELTSVPLLGQIACDAGFTAIGPLRPFVCDQFREIVLKKAEPIVHEILVVAKSFPDVNLWKLITLFGFELACDIAEDYGVPLAGEACGVLGAAVKAVADLSKAALEALESGVQAVVKVLPGFDGGPKTFAQEWWYEHMVRPQMYRRVSDRLHTGTKNLGMTDSEMGECIDHYGVQASACAVFSTRLKKDAEALLKYVLTVPDTYFDGWLPAAARDRARATYFSNDVEVYRNYIVKLDQADASTADARTSLVRGLLPIPVQIPKIAIPNYSSYYLPLYKECTSVVNERFGVEGDRTRRIEDWVCFEAVGKRFANALVAEKSRIAKSVIPLAQAFGCKSTKTGDSPELMFNCQSYAALGACLNLAREEYEGNHFCALDKPQAGMRLGIELVASLTAERCIYLDKDKSGAPKPRVACSRPWKRETCEALLQSYRVRWGIEDLSIRMQCDYYPDKNFLEQEARAKQIVAALNGTPVAQLAPDVGRRTLPPSLDSTLCRTLWDPLAINCPHQTKMPPLPDALATPPIESCPADPNKNGADRVCYQVVFTHEDQLREKENQPLSPLKAAPQNLPPSPVGPVRTATVSPQPAPSPATAASGIRAMNSQPNAGTAPPNPCRMAVNYYVPEPPIVSAISSRLLVNDQFQIQCPFKKVTREVEWPTCDDAARTSMQILKLSEEAGGRYSGIVAIDGNTVGVSSSPEDGSDFSGTKTWKFDAPGAHEVSCQVDNAFRYAAEGSSTYLNSTVTFDVSARTDGLTFRRFDPEAASTLPVRPLPSEAAPTARDGRFRLLQDAAPANPRSGLNGVRQPRSDVALSRGGNDTDVATPSGRSAGQMVTPSRTEAASSAATATTWDRTVLSCIIQPGNAPQYGTLNAFSEFEIWASNTSAKIVYAGQTISWQASGVSVSNTGFGGGQKWTRQNNYPVGTAIPIGGKVRVGRVSVSGIISSCEMWAQ